MSPVLQILQLPFVQIALLLMVVHGGKLDDRQSRIVTLEERTSPLRGH
ncbi:MAG: hypothetical protein M3Z36_03685 [Acidobacteriota bacterium]|nr:hypothetical protein [Acidobacteriota bacterium]